MPDPKAEKKKAYENAIKSINDLSADCKYEEAITLLPTAEDYPEKEMETQKPPYRPQPQKAQLAQIKLL